MYEETILQSLQSKRNGMVFDFMSNGTKGENMTCSLYDFTSLKNEEAENIYKNIVSLVNSNRYGNFKFSYSYNGKKKIARIILIGNTMEIHNLMTEYFSMGDSIFL